MTEDKPRLTRLIAMVTQLQAKRTVTARELAEKHQVSIRTVYRDIRTLESSGIPIVTEEGKGYSILESYRLPPVHFTEEEAFALITAEQLILKNKDQSLSEHYQNAIAKIKATLQHSQQSDTELIADRLQIRNNCENEKTSHYLIRLQSTISQQQIVAIDYLSLNGHRSQRELEPFALYTTKENWILIAFCRNKQDFRAFRLDCIQRLQLTGQHFSPHPLTLEQYLQTCREKWLPTPDTPLSPVDSSFAVKQKNNSMQPTTIAPFQLIGLSVRTSNNDGRAAKDIAELWGKFLAEGLLNKIPHKVDDTVYSLYTDYESDHNGPYTALLGCRVTSLADLPEGMVGRAFPGGNYVQLTARGDLRQGLIVNQWAKIWAMDLDRAYSADFEIFGDKARNSADAEVDFLVAVR